MPVFYFKTGNFFPNIKVATVSISNKTSFGKNNK